MKLRADGTRASVNVQILGLNYHLATCTPIRPTLDSSLDVRVRLSLLTWATEPCEL